MALNVAVGERLALAGASGAGKTTLLRMIAGLIAPDDGTIGCDSTEWFDSSTGLDVPPERRRCGVVFQDYALFPRMTALANVTFALAHLPRPLRRRHAGELLDRLGLASRRDAHPASLSGGERQRLALARALASDPLALLLDEPLAALDPASRAEASQVLTETLDELNRPAIVVTHDFIEAASVADRIAVLDGGRIIQTGTPSDIASSPASEFVAGFAGLNLLRGEVVDVAGGTTAIRLAAGTVIRSTDRGVGRVAATVHPWDLTLGPVGSAAVGSALNRVPGRIVSVHRFGARCRATIESPDALVAELSSESADRLGLAPGVGVEVSWKATATRIVGAGPGSGSRPLHPKATERYMYEHSPDKGGR